MKFERNRSNGGDLDWEASSDMIGRMEALSCNVWQLETGRCYGVKSSFETSIVEYGVSVILLSLKCRKSWRPLQQYPCQQSSVSRRGSVFWRLIFSRESEGSYSSEVESDGVQSIMTHPTMMEGRASRSEKFQPKRGRQRHTYVLRVVAVLGLRVLTSVSGHSGVSRWCLGSIGKSCKQSRLCEVRVCEHLLFSRSKRNGNGGDFFMSVKWCRKRYLSAACAL